MRAAAAGLALLASGCHIISGFDGLEFREDAELVWANRYGDSSPQRIDDVAALPDGQIRAIGTFDGTLDLGRGPLSGMNTDDHFIARFDPGGGAQWNELIDAFLVPRSLVPGTDGLLVSHAAEGTWLGADFAAIEGGRTRLSVVHIDAVDGGSATSDMLADATTLVSAVGGAVPGDPDGLVAGGTFAGEIGNSGGCPLTGDALELDESVFVGMWHEEVCEWLKPLGDAQPQWLDGIAADAGGNVVAAGRFRGSMDLGNGTTLQSGGGTDLFLFKLTAEGAPVWAHSFGQIDHDQTPIELVVRDTGTIVLAGFFEGDVNFGTGTLSSTQGSDIFVAKLGPSGNTAWTRHFAVPNDPFEEPGQVLTRVSLAVDGEGNTIVAGHFRGEVDFGGTTRTANGEIDLFLVKLDLDGELLWSGAFGDGQLQCQWTDCTTSLAIDPGQNILLGGILYGNMNLGRNDLAAEGAESDAFLAKFLP
jgi:hypothetical protein